MDDEYDDFVPDTLDAIQELSEGTESSLEDGYFVQGAEVGFGTMPKVLSQLDRTCQDTIVEEGTENDESSNTGSINGVGHHAHGNEPRIVGDEFGFSISPVKSPLRSPKPTMRGKVKTLLETKSFDWNGSIMMFDFDGDSSGSSFDKKSPTVEFDADEDDLSWRLDPSRSMSDWSITVNVIGTRVSKDYFVHKNMLAVGKRKSPYFADLFKAQQRDGTARTTELTFPKLASEAMPALLDYVYEGEETLQLSSATAPGLRYVAQFFGIRVLFEKIMQFIQTDLTLKTLTAYYIAGLDLEDRKVLNVVSKHIVRNISLIEESHGIIEVMEPSFFTKVLSSSDLGSPENKVHSSILLARYCEVWKDKLDKETFNKLTGEEFLGRVYHGAALPLLEIESDLGICPPHGEMTSLQRRCIDALTPKWDSLCDVDPDKTRRICNKLPATAITELMMQSLAKAKSYSDNEIKSIQTVESDKRSHITSTLKSHYDKMVKELRSICADKDRVIKMYTMEMARYRRLPNSPNGKITASGRSNQPSVLPDIVKHEPDGYLLVNKKQNEKLPVFYYQ